MFDPYQLYPISSPNSHSAQVIRQRNYPSPNYFIDISQLPYYTDFLSTNPSYIPDNFVCPRIYNPRTSEKPPGWSCSFDPEEDDPEPPHPTPTPAPTAEPSPAPITPVPTPSPTPVPTPIPPLLSSFQNCFIINSSYQKRLSSKRFNSFFSILDRVTPCNSLIKLMPSFPARTWTIIVKEITIVAAAVGETHPPLPDGSVIYQIYHYFNLSTRNTESVQVQFAASPFTQANSLVQVRFLTAPMDFDISEDFYSYIFLNNNSAAHQITGFTLLFSRDQVPYQPYYTSYTQHLAHYDLIDAPPTQGSSPVHIDCVVAQDDSFIYLPHLTSLY